MFCSRKLMMIALLIVMSTCGTAAAQFEDLAKRVPGTANVLVMFNVEKIFRSPIAIRDGWEKKARDAYASKVIYLPPTADYFMLGAQVNVETMQPVWQVAVCRMAQIPQMTVLAKDRGGNLDTVQGFSAVHLPTDVYVVDLGNNVVGAMAPGNRQHVGRWIRESDSNTLSPYLAEAVRFEDAGTEIIMAMDLTDVMTTPMILERLKHIKAIENVDVDVEELAKLIASTRGVTLGITMGEKPYGRIKVDFGRNSSMMKGYGKALLLEVLSNQGAFLSEMEGWTEQIDANQISIGGYLTESGMRRILSVVDTHAESMTPQQQVSASAAQTESSEDDIAYTTQTYFHSVQTLIDDFRDDKKKARTMGQIGVWLDKYARKVDRLPMVNVDPEMLNYGAYISGQLRNASSAIKGIGISSRVGQVNAVNSGGAYVAGSRYVRGGGWNYSEGYTTQWKGRYEQQSERTQVRVNAKARGVSSAQAIFQDIDNASAQIRQMMVQKYKIEF